MTTILRGGRNEATHQATHDGTAGHDGTGVRDGRRGRRTDRGRRIGQRNGRHPAHGVEQLRRLQLERHRGRRQGQRRLHEDQPQAARLAVRRHRLGVVLPGPAQQQPEPGRQPQPPAAHGRQRPAAARHHAFPVGGGQQRVQAAGRLRPRTGPEVRRAPDARHPAPGRGRQRAHRRHQLSRQPDQQQHHRGLAQPHVGPEHEQRLRAVLPRLDVPAPGELGRGLRQGRRHRRAHVPAGRGRGLPAGDRAQRAADGAQPLPRPDPGVRRAARAGQRAHVAHRQRPVGRLAGCQQPVRPAARLDGPTERRAPTRTPT